MKALIYNQSSRSVEPLTKMLQHSGISSEVCLTEKQLRHLSLTDRYIAVILRADNRDVLAKDVYLRLREAGCTSAFVVLTTLDSGLVRARALQAGVHAYFIEPCSYVKVISELISLAHRQVTVTGKGIAGGRFYLDPMTRCVRFDGKDVSLSKTGFELLSLLLRHKGTVLTRAQIWEGLWGYEEYPLANTVDVHVMRLRAKLGPEGAPLIRTEYGLGYRMDESA
jgi:DNA-binding response OmpR family regulator